MNRPWQGQQEKPQEEFIAAFQPNNPLSPGAKRPGGMVFIFSLYVSGITITRADPAVQGPVNLGGLRPA